MKYVERIVLELLDERAWKATKYISHKQIVRATQRLGRHGRLGTRDRADIVLTIARPNYAERKFIKNLMKAGEPFPVKKVQLKYPPKKSGRRKNRG